MEELNVFETEEGEEGGVDGSWEAVLWSEGEDDGDDDGGDGAGEAGVEVVVQEPRRVGKTEATPVEVEEDGEGGFGFGEVEAEVGVTRDVVDGDAVDGGGVRGDWVYEGEG